MKFCDDVHEFLAQFGVKILRDEIGKPMEFDLDDVGPIEVGVLAAHCREAERRARVHRVRDNFGRTAYQLLALANAKQEIWRSRERSSRTS